MEFGLSYPQGNTKTRMYSFGGLNRTRKSGRNEFADMYNMSANEYPCIAPQGGRMKITDSTDTIKAIAPPDPCNTEELTGITGVCGNAFYYNGVVKSGHRKLDANALWQVERKGNLYIINGYDSTNKSSAIYYYNINTDEFDEGGVVMRNLILSARNNYLRTITVDEVGISSYSVTKPDGTVISNADFFTEYKDYITTDAIGQSTMSDTENIFEQYFKVGDELTIEGFCGKDNSGELWSSNRGYIYPYTDVSALANNTTDTDNVTDVASLSKELICRAVVKSFEKQTDSYKRTVHLIYFDLYDKDGEIMYFKDLLSERIFCSGVVLKKRTRALDNITIHHGRIWGSQPSGNNIFASPSDNLFSFSAEDITNGYGVRMNSDTPGAFTALCSYNNDLIAFKPDSITVISGTNPMNYHSSVINGVGCISKKSVAVTPNGVIFLGYNGFYLYNGSLPYCLSTKLNGKYVSAVAGYDGTSYYANALRSDGVRELLVYNTRYGLWHKEDDTDFVDFFGYKNEFYMADEHNLYKSNASAPNDWSFTFARTHDDDLDNKGINEIWIRAEIYDGAEFTIETAVDGEEFVHHTTFDESGLMVYRCPVRLRVRNSYRIKVRGSGKVVFYEFEIRKSDGGRRYKER